MSPLTIDVSNVLLVIFDLYLTFNLERFMNYMNYKLSTAFISLAAVGLHEVLIILMVIKNIV